jgi:Mn2+/Fe2+ NRAMP family transporter
MKQKKQNLYILSEILIKEPPQGFFGSIKYLGPGMVLSASIVGSGELIATTALGAQAGFVTLWVIIVSCLVKVALQLEFGKHTINTGETTMVSLNKLPGLRIKEVHWTIWVWILIFAITKFIQMGGIVGGVAQALNIMFPSLSVSVWAWFTAISVALLVFRGYYQFIQNFSILLIGLFTLFNIFCVVVIQYTPYSISFGDILSGLSFKLPGYAVVFAVAAFGITGVGGDEIMQYPYWCIEKGYAAFTGPRKNAPEWIRRAKGWIKVMYLDAIISMVIYTVATISFYMLGAAVLHGRSEIPKGYEMVRTLSKMYTESVGPGAKYIFLFGAVIVLYSTLFSALAAWSRTFGDAFGRLKLIDYFDKKQREKFIAIFAWITAFIWLTLYILIKEPVIMVSLGGIGTAVILLIVVYVTYYYRYKWLSKELYPSKIYDVFLWLSAIVIICVGIKVFYSSIGEIF